MTQRSSTFWFIFTLAVSLLAPCQLQAQRNRHKSAPEPDTLGLYRGVTVGVNIAGIAQRALSSYGEYEAMVRVSLRDRYFPVVEVGIGSCDADDVATAVRFKTSAPFARIGCDFNLMRNKHDIYRLFLGGRLAYTSFKYDISAAPIDDPAFGGQADYSATGVSCSQGWYEAVGGVEAKIWGPVRLGWSVRYKGRLTHKDGDVGKPYYIPGYGRNGSTKLGATFHVIISL